MTKLKKTLEKINLVLAKYYIDPITEEEVMGLEDTMFMPDDTAEASKALDEVWRRIRAREALNLFNRGDEPPLEN
jgi:hypothetical protein